MGFERLGIVCGVEGDDLVVPSGQTMKIHDDFGGHVPKLEDQPWPAFPADLMSIAIVTATQCDGVILMFEKMFESRMFFVDKLISMGARIVLCDPHRAIVAGPSRLRGAPMTSPDIRAGMAMLLAAVAAEGTRPSTTPTRSSAAMSASRSGSMRWAPRLRACRRETADKRASGAVTFSALRRW